MDTMIEVRGLRREFGDLVAVNDISIRVKKGEVFGFLGPNGAGKTTTISMLSGLLEPTSGSASIGGFDIKKDPRRAKELIGVCPQEVAVFKFLSGMENIILFGNLHGMDKKLIKERAADLVANAGFEEAGS